MPTYFVTGATGFVGAALTRRLLAAGHDVRALGRPEGHQDGTSGAQTGERAGAARVMLASLGDPNAIAEAIGGSEVLFHCAAENSSRAAPNACAWINVAGTENVLNAARSAGVRRVVHLSCCDATLVNRDRVSWKESHQLGEEPLDPCSRSKLLAEELALQASDRTLQVCVLRPAWVWGPGDRRMLPALCREGARGRVQLCGRGENLVPTVYVENLVDALLSAAEAPTAPGRCYHVLDNEVLNAAEFIGQLCQSVGLAPPARGSYTLAYASAWLRDRLHLPGLSRADVVRRGRSALFDGVGAAHDLGYEAKVTIAEGMQRLAAWAEELGGPDGIARTERSPASANEVNNMMRMADAHA